MSSPDRAKARLGWIAVLAVVAPLLSGCIESVQPLYGTTAFGGTSALASRLQAIAVDPIGGRLGHYLGNELIFQLNGTGSQVPPHYHLLITLHEASQTPVIDTVSGIATAATVVTTADFRLVPNAGPEPIFKGTAYVAASYDRTSQRYADVRAARDAEIRAARTLADQIRTQVAAELATRS